VQFSASRAAVVSSADHKVQADYAANVLAVAKDEAVALVDANQRDKAAGVLRERAKELQAMGALYKNSAVQELAAPAAPEADRLEREGLGNSERKAYRADNAQVRSQQSSGR
jgi:Ca-activated chloride channel homolog